MGSSQRVQPQPGDPPPKFKPMNSRRPSRNATRQPPTLLRFNRLPLAAIGLCMLSWAQASAHRQAPARVIPSASLAADPCLMPAAQRHGVNPHILRAILQVESGMRPHVVSRNRNGSIDVGMAQINSIHFRELAQWGITPDRLLDPCIATHVAAWHLKRVMLRHGNTWFGVAAYHSATPVHNQRYQALLRQELVRTGVWR
ncbi:hypothetical protein B9Z50_10550 [Limnohabitans sp. Bal53]|nr:hypothetical protein B9Z50_10550 [Limnohabitans sp. Bal53]